ncbi:unnamed protein product [Urochloa humidicola]
MDMDHQLQQLLHFSAQEHFVMASPPGFFAVDGGGGDPAHFQPAGGFVEDDDGGWVENLMQLGDELLFGGGDAIAAAAGGATGDHVPWQGYDDDNGGGSPDDDPPSSVSLDDGGGSPPSGELASEPRREDGGGGASPAARKRRDRSKTIVSERKRRVRMKEKLYELRSLVPNITKMDKASIIADAVVYVRNLQAHARKLNDEVAALEARPRSGQEQHNRRTAAAAGRRRQGRDEGNNNNAGSGGGALVTHVGAAQVGDGRFFVTVECERRDGVAAPLCAAVESLACFRVESSSLVVRSGPDRVVSTLTLKVNNEQVGDAAVCEGSVVKLLVMAALLKEGFRHEPAAAAVEIS